VEFWGITLSPTQFFDDPEKRKPPGNPGGF
jgi:hypothetical protein